MKLVVLLLTCMVSLAYADKPKCCTPDQWEADLYWDNGNVFIDSDIKTKPPNVGTAYSYINGTAKTAYDFTNGRTFTQVSVTEVSPLIPNPVTENTTIIRDFKNGMQYQITGNECDKSQLDPLKRHCVPDSAMNLGDGFLVSPRVPVTTYAYMFTVDIPYRVQATVSQIDAVCLPVHVTYFIPSAEEGSGAVNNLEYLNVMPGIKDPSIFNIPPQCKSAKVVGRTKRRWISPFEFL